MPLIQLRPQPFDEIYMEGNSVIFRSSRVNEAAIAHRVTDEETGEDYYSILTVVPSRRPVWGSPVWRTGRAHLPANRLLKPGATNPSPDRESQQSGRQTLGKIQTEHFDLSKERERLQAKRQPIAGKDVKVTVKKRRVFRAKDDPQFSRPSRAITGDDTLISAGLSILARNDEMFQLPVSESKNMAGIAAEVYPGIKVREGGRDEARTFNVSAVRAWTLNLTDKNGKLQTASVIELPGREIYLNVSDFHEGGAGNRIYHIAANFAHNNGMVFIGDPYGLSDAALYRRTESMLSSALKFGTTAHLAPHERQLEGDAELGVPPLDWRPGEDAHNINKLAEVSFASIVRHVSELANIKYNFEAHRFEDAHGNEVSDKRFVELAARPGARKARAGRDTLKRGALLNTLVQTGRGAERGRVLGELLRQSSEHLDPALRRIFYSRNVPGTPGTTAPTARKLLVEAFGEPAIRNLEKNGILKIVQNKDGVPEEARGGMRGDEEAVYYNGTALTG